MSTVLDAIDLDSAGIVISSAADTFDIGAHFSRWLQDLHGAHKLIAPQTQESTAEENSEFYIGSFPGSNCEVAFDGVLHFDGYSIGNISSPEGTLILTKRGRIEADINVRIAVISGSVTGNITATERVVLESEAQVTGQIRTAALSVRLGAIFDGDCLFTSADESAKVEHLSGERQAHDELEYVAMRASA
jgi:cytoskeletal protein CcmA (bactofilin family)